LHPEFRYELGARSNSAEEVEVEIRITMASYYLQKRFQLLMSIQMPCILNEHKRKKCIIDISFIE